MIDHERRVRQQTRRADRRSVDRGRVDRDELDPRPELGRALGQPVDHGRAGAAFLLAEQALVAVEVDEPGVPRVDPHPPTLVLVVGPPGLSAAGLVDTEYPRRSRLGQRCVGVVDEGAVRGRPGHPMGIGDLSH